MARKAKAVPRERLVELAKLIADKHALEVEQAHTQALMIRGCIAALKQTTGDTARKLEAEMRASNKRYTHMPMHLPQRRLNEDRALAFLHLEWLATQLEDVR